MLTAVIKLLTYTYMKNSANQDKKTKVNFSTFILRRVGELGDATLDILFPANYSETRALRQALGLPSSYAFSRRSFSALLSRLKKQGLVEQRDYGKGKTWILSIQGERCVRQFELAQRTAKPDGKKRIVTFDIPEDERYKREWIRRELAACDFVLLHQSVWIGDHPLSEDFVKGLKKLGLQKYVHIFSIENPGTLEKE